MSSQTASRSQSSHLFPLYNDVLQSIVKFLTEHQLHVTAQISKQWYQILQSMQPIGIHTWILPGKLVRLRPHSVVARHITNFIHLGTSVDSNRLLIQQLDKLLPSLTTIDVGHYSAIIPQVGDYCLPRSLKSFRISVSSVNRCPPLFRALSSLKHLRSLSLLITLPSVESHEQGYPTRHLYSRGDSLRNIDFVPLMPLASSLQQLTFQFQGYDWRREDEAEAMEIMPASLIEFVRHLSVSEVSIDVPETGGSSAFMARSWECVTASDDHYSTLPPIVQSRSLAFIDMGNTTLNRAILESFIKIPSLQTLKPTNIDLAAEDIPLLSNLPGIRALSLWMMASESRTTSAECVSICTSFPKLEELRLTFWDLTSHQLNEILERLPELTVLDLNECMRINSLAPLSKYRLPQRLKKLYLTDMCIPVPDLVNYILPLTKLESLELQRICQEAVPKAIQAQLQAMPNVSNYSLDFSVPGVEDIYR